ncbi:hypothetical protein [Paenibacillus barengoltzii]|nr:hypothetical protein [Paenibacillus barengoltzii]
MRDLRRNGPERPYLLEKMSIHNVTDWRAVIRLEWAELMVQTAK